MRKSLLIIVFAVVPIVTTIGIMMAVHFTKDSPAEMLANCNQTTNNPLRIEACRKFVRYSKTPEDKGSANTELCAALTNAHSWKDALLPCAQGNIPHPWAANYANLAAAEYKLENYTGSLADVNEALRIDSQLWQAFYIRSLVYGELGDKEKAEADFEESQRLKKLAEEKNPG